MSHTTSVVNDHAPLSQVVEITEVPRLLQFDQSHTIVNVMNASQQQTWKRAKQEVSRLVDGHGMPVDDEIAETVAILRLMGFHTTMSCAGHLDRITGGPYVMFRSPEAKTYLMRSSEIADPADLKRKLLYRKATEANMREMRILLEYLDRFYSARPVSQSQRLILKGFGPTAWYLICQDAELAYVVDVSTRQRLLEDDRAEMGRLTEFLKTAYWREGRGVNPHVS